MHCKVTMIVREGDRCAGVAWVLSLVLQRGLHHTQCSEGKT